MILMVSVQNLHEAVEAIEGGADIVDVKNLQEALVGSAEPSLVRDVRARVPIPHHASVTLGVVPNQIGTVAMATYAAGALNATSVKVGFMNTRYEEAVATLKACRDALDGFETKLIGSLFADNLLYGGLEPRRICELAVEGNCEGWLIDTLVKDGRNLFDFIPENELTEMVFHGKTQGMSTALSGHLKIDDLDELARINPDIVGVRGAVCAAGERKEGVHREAVAEFKNQLTRRQSGEVQVRNSNGIPSQDVADWYLVDGTGQNCASILAALNEQVERNGDAIIEVIMPDVLNSYDIVIWAEKQGHNILTQRLDTDGSTRMLIKP